MLYKISFVIILISIAFYMVVQFMLPDYKESVTISHPNITNDIEIYRDRFGIPHIKGNNLMETFYGLGYVHGQDRAWQMNFRRLASQGRLSEVLGNKTVEIDKHIRNLGLSESSRRITQNLDETLNKYLQMYADGVNEGVRQLQVMPVEFQLLRAKFEDWTVYDSINFAKFMAFLNINDISAEYLRSEIEDLYGTEDSKILGAVGPDNQFYSHLSILNENETAEHTKLYDSEAVQRGQRLNAQQPKQHKPPNINKHFYDSLIFEDLASELLPSFDGSNSWVVHGNHTKSGKPIFCSDPHLENQMPSQWYQAELIYKHNGEEYFVIGATLPAIPFTLSGRSKYLAWGPTILYSDGSDLWEEHIIEKDGQLFQVYKDQLNQIKVVEEVIKVKDAQPVKTKVMFTNHGPVMNSDKYKPATNANQNTYISIQTVAHLDDINGLKGFINIMNERNLTTALNLLANISYPNLGMAFASVDGDIGYVAVGKLVIREGSPDTSAYVKPGWTGQDEWIGFVQFSEHLKAINPAKGYLALSNNKFIHSNNKYHQGWSSNPTARAKRVNELIQQYIARGQKLTIEDMKAIQTDTTDSYAQEGVPDIIQLVEYAIRDKLYNNLLNEPSCVEGKTLAFTLLDSLRMLKSWNYQLTKESVEASLFMKFEYFYIRKFMKKLQREQPNSHHTWGSYYIFDSFNFKNLDEMSKAIHSEDKSIFDREYCDGGSQPTIQYRCLYNIIESLTEAYCSLNRQFGNDTSEWQWQRLHQHVFSHPPFSQQPFLKYLFERRKPQSGNRRTVNPSNIILKDENLHEGIQGPNYRMLVSMDESESSYFVLDTGISGNIFSKHYDDQQALFFNNEYVEMTWGSENLERVTTHHAVLKVYKNATKGNVNDDI